MAIELTETCSIEGNKGQRSYVNKLHKIALKLLYNSQNCLTLMINHWQNVYCKKTKNTVPSIVDIPQ